MTSSSGPRDPNGPEDPLGPSGTGDAGESLAEAFWSLARQMRHASQESMSRWDLNPSQARALRVLVRNGVMRPSELSETLRIAARSATEVIDDLEAKGLVFSGKRLNFLEVLPIPCLQN